MSLKVSTADGARAHLAQVKKWYYNPLLSNEDQAIAFLSTPAVNREPFHAIALNRRAYFYSDKGQLVQVDFNDDIVPPSYFLDTVSLGTAADELAERILSTRALQPFHGWDIHLVKTGEVIVTDFKAGQIAAFVSSLKKGNDYFDFVVYGAHGLINYNTRQQGKVKGVVHSGDVGSLLHHVSLGAALPKEQWHVLAVVGFRSQMLRNFRDQLPAVCIPSDNEKVVHIVPCPLDEASVQDNTMACLVSFKLLESGDRVMWAVAPTPVTAVGVDTGHFNNTVQECYATCIRDCGPVIASHLESLERQRTLSGCNDEEGSLTGTSAEEDQAQQQADTKYKTGSMKYDANKWLSAVFIETNVPTEVVAALRDELRARAAGLGGDGAISSDLLSSHLVVCFGDGISVPEFLSSAADDERDGETATVLPCITGLQQGCPALALGRGYRSQVLSPARYWTALQQTPFRMVHLSDMKYLQSLAQKKEGSESLLHSLARGDKVPKNELEKALNAVSIVGVSALAGPLSLVVVQLGSKRYFYRGTPWPGTEESLVKLIGRENLEFGDDITEVLSDANLFSLCATTGVTSGYGFTPTSKPPPPLYVKGSRAVFFQGKVWQEAGDAVQAVLGMSSGELFASKEDVIRLLTQTQVMLDAAALSEFLKPLIAFSTKLQGSMIKPFNEELAAAVAAKQDIAQVGRKVAQKRKQVKSEIQWFINLIGNCVSVKGSSTRSHDLNRLRRKQTIGSNVAEAKEMKFPQLCELLEESCHDETGCCVAHIEPTPFKKVLKAISEESFRTVKYSEQQFVTLNSRLLMLDPITVGALQEVSTTATILDPQQPGALAVTMTGLNQQTAVPLPLLRKYVELKDAGDLFWIEECNDPTVAKLRILFRQTVAESVSTREVGSISPASKDLGFGILSMIIQAIERLATNNIATAAQEEDEHYEEGASAAHATTTTATPMPQGSANASDGLLRFNDTKAQMCRGLYGLLLTTMASGTNPMSMAWQLVMPNPNIVGCPSWEVLWQYSQLAVHFHATAWPTENLIKNVRQLVVRIIRREVTDKVTDPMRKQLTMVKAIKDADLQRLIDAELSYLRLASEVLFLMARMPAEQLNNVERRSTIATEMQKHQPHDPRKRHRGGSYARMVKYFKNLPTANAADLPEALQNMCQMALDVTTKRSGCFAADKEELLRAHREAIGVGKAKKALVQHVHQLKHKATVGAEDKSPSFTPNTPPPEGDSPSSTSTGGKLLHVHVQNAEAVKQGDAGRLKGDAELKRVPWALAPPAQAQGTTGTASAAGSSDVAVQETLHLASFITGVTAISGSGGGHEDSHSLAPTQKEAPVMVATAVQEEKEVKSLSEGERLAAQLVEETSEAVAKHAAALATQLGRLTIKDKVPPAHWSEFVSLCAVGLPPVGQGQSGADGTTHPLSTEKRCDVLFRRVVAECLAHWRDTMEGESFALRKAFKDL